MSMIEARAAQLRGVGFKGKGLDLAALLLEAQSIIERMDFGRVTFHIGSNKVTLSIDTQVSHRRWGEGDHVLT